MFGRIKALFNRRNRVFFEKYKEALEEEKKREEEVKEMS